MRLIDADDLINNLVNACNNDQSKFLPVWIEKQIDTQPTIDAVSIVRCRDCEYHGKGNCSAGAGIAYPTPDDWFCADGQRRDDNG